MSEMPSFLARRRVLANSAAAAIAVALVVLGRSVLAQQDKYALYKYPNGLKFSDFRGYENWQVVAVSQTDQIC